MITFRKLGYFNWFQHMSHLSLLKTYSMIYNANLIKNGFTNRAVGTRAKIQSYLIVFPSQGSFCVI